LADEVSRERDRLRLEVDSARREREGEREKVLQLRERVLSLESSCAFSSSFVLSSSPPRCYLAALPFLVSRHSHLFLFRSVLTLLPPFKAANGRSESRASTSAFGTPSLTGASGQAFVDRLRKKVNELNQQVVKSNEQIAALMEENSASSFSPPSLPFLGEVRRLLTSFFLPFALRSYASLPGGRVNGAYLSSKCNIADCIELHLRPTSIYSAPCVRGGASMLEEETGASPSLQLHRSRQPRKEKE
jgi:hypothetical protein